MILTGLYKLKVKSLRIVFDTGYCVLLGLRGTRSLGHPAFWPIFVLRFVMALCVRKTSMSSKAANQPKKELKRSDVDFVAGPPANLGSFGGRPVRSPESLYLKMGKMGNNGGGTGSVTTKRELGLVVTDFFDYTNDYAAVGVDQFVNSYIWDIAQNLFDTTGSAPVAGSDQTFCRVRKVEVWVLPQSRTFAGAASVNNANSMYTVNVQVPGTSNQFVSSSATAQAFATNTQVTNVLPMIDTKWKKVLTADMQKTFQSGVIRPVFAASGITNQCLFSMSIVNPTSGLPYQEGDDVPPIRVKVKLTIDQPIGTINAAKLAVYRNEEFALPFTGQNGPDFVDTSLQYVQIDLRSVRDNMS